MAIKIDFADFWGGFDKNQNYIYWLLSKRFDIELSDKPDFLIYSMYSDTNLDYSNCVKIFFTPENIRPDFTECHYAISFDYMTRANHLRSPLFLWCGYDLSKMTQVLDADKIFEEKTKFCNFVYSNIHCKKRNVFFEQLSKYKKVDSGGKVFNNLGYNVGDKLEFIKQYKFTIAFENSSYPGYTTEKIIQPFVADSVPIYWGNPVVHRDFNRKAFINVHDFKNFDKVIEHIIEVDNNDELYKEYLRQPKFNDGVFPPSFTEEYILDFFSKIFSSNTKTARLDSKGLLYRIDKWRDRDRKFH